MEDDVIKLLQMPLYGKSVSNLEARLGEILLKPLPPEVESMTVLCNSANSVLDNENEVIRPRDRRGRPGGLLRLNKNIPTVVVPDLHARMDFFYSAMMTPIFGTQTILELFAAKQLQMVCVGDAFHSEGHQARRWKLAFDEFQLKYQKHESMDCEMRDSMCLAEMIMEVKRAFPDHFHFLKGNHENILNENGSGNYPFRKFAYEGAMVLEYMKMFYGPIFLKLYAMFEKKLPLLAVGDNFMISHSEPETFFCTDDVVNFRSNQEVVYGLTWTDNGAAQPGSVMQMIMHYLSPETWNEAVYLGGHRPVANAYQTRADGRYLQIHNPQRFQVVILPCGRPADLTIDVINIPDRSMTVREKTRMAKR